LRTLESWIAPSVWEKTPLVKLCWTFLQDFHHSKAVIQYEPQLIALAIIYFGLQIYGISVPCTSESDPVPWHEVNIETFKWFSNSLLIIDFINSFDSFTITSVFKQSTCYFLTIDQF